MPGRWRVDSIKLAPLEHTTRKPILEDMIPELKAETAPVKKRMPVVVYFAIASAIVVGALWNVVAVNLWNGVARFPRDALGKFLLQCSIAFMVISYVAAVGIGLRKYVPARSMMMAIYTFGARLYLTILILTLGFFPIGTVVAVIAGIFLLCGPTQEYLGVTFYPAKLSWMRDRQ
jgi:hypothetical protein